MARPRINSESAYQVFCVKIMDLEGTDKTVTAFESRKKATDYRDALEEHLYDEFVIVESLTVHQGVETVIDPTEA